MSAADLLLTVRGQDDRWLSMAPDRTYFEAKYQPRVNRSRETYEIPFDNQDATFGSTGRCTIPVKGDYMTRMTLRTVMPPIYPTVPGQYVFPTPSSEVGATVYVNKQLELVVADGTTLTANTVGNHYFSIGAQVTLAGTAYVIFDLDGTYTVTSIPTANSFTCSTTLAGISYNGTVSSPGIQCGDIISYFSTTNSNLWVNNVTNKTWQITGGSGVGNVWTFTTSAPSNFPVGSQLIINLVGAGIKNQIATVTSSTDTTFTYTISTQFFVMIGTNTAYSSDNGQTWNNAVSPSGGGVSVTFGNGSFVKVDTNKQAYSLNNGVTWSSVASPLVGYWNSVAYGNGTFITVGYGDSGYIATGNTAYSNDGGYSWTRSAFSPAQVRWTSVAYGNGVFVTVGRALSSNSDIISITSDYGVTWSTPYVVTVGVPYQLNRWTSIAYGNGVFVMVGDGGVTSQAYSIDYGQSWTTVVTPLSGSWSSVAYGNGVFVMVGGGGTARSNTYGQSWTSTSSYGAYGVSFGNGVFVAVGGSSQIYSIDNGQTWISTTSPLLGYWGSIAFGNFSYVNSPSDSAAFVAPPLQLTNRVFSSSVYPSISFQNAADAAFWGFDSREGLTYSLTATPPWTLTQAGWISGFLPPSTSTYDDSVAHKLCKAVRVLVGKQTIKEYSGEYIELQNDLLVPYENKAILKLMNGTLDQTQATVAREYYVNLPLGTKEVPLCALTHQNMSVEVDFDSYLNLSQNLNQGTGDFTDSKSYVTYNASTGILNGQPINVQTTFSYQQYIFIVTYGGQFIIYDTTKNVDDPASYIVLSAFSGSNLFKQFCVLSGNLYIGLTNGQLASMIINEIIQGNISSFITNNYTPTTGSLTGTIVSDFRYVYYTVSNTATSNVFMSQYDTTASFTSTGSYKTVDFTKTFNSNITGVYQTLSTGTELVLLPQGTPGKLYTYQLNANVQSQWYSLDYSTYGYQITEGVLLGDSVYFVCDNFLVIKYVNSTFTTFTTLVNVFNIVAAPYNQAYSIDNGKTWKNPVNIYNSYLTGVAYGNGVFVACNSFSAIYSLDNGYSWTSTTSSVSNTYRVVFGNNTFVMVGYTRQYYSIDNGRTWSSVTSTLGGDWRGTAFGNGVFVMTGANVQAYSTDNGRTWNLVASPLSGQWYSVAFGNGVFVMVATGGSQAYSTDNGRTWNRVAVPLFGIWNGVAFGGSGVFVMTGVNVQAYSTDNGRTWNNLVVPLFGQWLDVTFGNGVAVMVGSSDYYRAYSTDNGRTWTPSTPPTGIWNNWSGIGVSPAKTIIPGDGLRNLTAVGNYIYCSTNNVAVQIDTTQDLSTAAAYKFPAPLPVNQYVLANGPRYVYMFAQGDNTATNIVEFDPYGPDTTFKASILVDYESLPPEVPKPDKALLGLIQTQKVTDMNYMNIKGPVKELWVTGASATTNVFQYSNLAPRSSLALTGEKIVTEDEGTHTFLNIIEPFETHTSMPIRNVSVVAFELDPESEIPNGTINFSRIRDQVFEGGAQTVWARNYNLLKIQGGIGGLIFNS